MGSARGAGSLGPLLVVSALRPLACFLLPGPQTSGAWGPHPPSVTSALCAGGPLSGPFLRFFLRYRRRALSLLGLGAKMQKKYDTWSRSVPVAGRCRTPTGRPWQQDGEWPSPGSGARGRGSRAACRAGTSCRDFCRDFLRDFLWASGSPRALAATRRAACWSPRPPDRAVWLGATSFLQSRGNGAGCVQTLAVL